MPPLSRFLQIAFKKIVPCLIRRSVNGGRLSHPLLEALCSISLWWNYSLDLQKPLVGLIWRVYLIEYIYSLLISRIFPISNRIQFVPLHAIKWKHIM